MDETKFELLALAEETGLTGERLEEFRDALDAATADYATVPDESRLPVIRNRGHIRCDAGMKASRIINRLCAKFGIDQYAPPFLFPMQKADARFRRLLATRFSFICF